MNASPSPTADRSVRNYVTLAALMFAQEDPQVWRSPTMSAGCAGDRESRGGPAVPEDLPQTLVHLTKADCGRAGAPLGRRRRGARNRAKGTND